MIRINFTSVLVDDQDKALEFYTQKLGFETKTEIPVGEHRWLTVCSPADPEGPQLILEPTTTLRPGSSRWRWLRTVFPSRLSPWTTPEPSTSDSAPPASVSPRNHWRWGISPRSCSMTPAAT